MGNAEKSPGCYLDKTQISICNLIYSEIILISESVAYISGVKII